MFGEYSHTQKLDGPAVDVVERAYAKVNPVLLVGERRSDGYHSVVTILHHVALCDDVRVRIWPAKGGSRGVNGAASSMKHVVTVVSDLPGLPANEENLAGKAALELLEASGVERCGVVVDINKRIPVAAGLAGGSADAAAVLRVLWREVAPSLSREEVLAIAARLGSDVPACLIGGTALCEGRGERVRPVRSRTWWWVLANPGVPLKTADVYRMYDLGEVRNELDLERSAPGLQDALAGENPGELAARLRNDLEVPALALRPEIRDVMAAMRRAGALACLVSGSGPTVAGLARDRIGARRIAESLGGSVPWVWWGPSAPTETDRE